MFNLKKSKQQRKYEKTRLLESFDYYNNKLTSFYDSKDDEHLLWCINRYYKFCLYWYSDEPEKIYLAEVKVFKRFRNKGFGNILLKHAKYLAKNYFKHNNFKLLFLKVNKNTWKYHWYIRNGFELYENSSQYKDETNIWCWLKFNII